jgi:hypothetical protein
MRTLRRWVNGSVSVMLAFVSLATAVFGVASRGRVMFLTHDAYSMGPNQLETLSENELCVSSGLFQFTYDVQSPPCNGADDYEKDRITPPWSSFFAELESFGPTNRPSLTSYPKFSFAVTPLPHGGYARDYGIYGLGCGWSFQPRYQDRPAELPYYPEVKGDERAWRRTWYVEASWWYLSILTAVYPCRCFARRLARRFRPAVGFCQACGYDLRASPHQCPECGKLRDPEKGS